MERELSFYYSLFCECNGVTTDSRNCPVGTMFVALRGTNFDGNKFAEDAIKKGCRYAIVSEKGIADGERIFYVEDTLAFLQALASRHRDELGVFVIGITGSNGKTTTKELCAAVLTKKYGDMLLYTTGNLNNQIGVPLTLLRLKRTHELAIVEMGASHPGDIKELVEIAKPNFGLITSVGRAHLEGFGSFEGVVRTKCELYDYIRENGGEVQVDECQKELFGESEGMKRFVYRSSGEGACARITGCSPYLKVMLPNGKECETKLIGDYNYTNVLNAYFVGKKFGVSDEDIVAAIEGYVPSNSRSQYCKTERNELIIDAYNANPTSMGCSVRNFMGMEAERKAVILGDMKELGEYAEEEHRRIVEMVEGRFERVVLVGANFGAVAREGMEVYENAEGLIEALEREPMEGFTVLVKGSNSVGLGKVVGYL